MQRTWFPRGGRKQTASRTTPLPYGGSLVRTVLITLMLLSLLPFLLIGTLNYFRSRDLLEAQTYRQLETISTRQAQQVQEFVRLREETVTRLVTDERFTQAVQALLNNPATSEAYETARQALRDEMERDPQSTIANAFDLVWLVLPDGSIAYANDPRWVTENFGGLRISDPDLLALIGSNNSRFLYHPATGFYQTMGLFSTRSFVDEDNQLAATLIAVSTASFPFQVLSDAAALLPEINSYFFTSQMQIVGSGEWGLLRLVYGGMGLNESLGGIINNANTVMRFSPRTFAGENVIAYAQWFPAYNLGVLQTYPIQAVYEQNPLFDSFNLGLIGFSLILTGVVVYLGSTRLVNPLLQLARAADSFSRGNWDERARVSRRDEIGLLAASFNRMAEELSAMYRSLEAVVEKRTSQLRIAAEVGQMATMPEKAASLHADMLNRAVELIADRFGFYHVALYLTDESGKALVLREAAGTSSEERKQRGSRLAIDEHSLPGWTIVNRAARCIPVVEGEPLYHKDELLPETRSQLCVPLAAGMDLFGVLDIHSIVEDAFDPETITVFQTLANQISGTLQNTRLLDATQINYEETTLLYRITRQVTQARSEEEILRHLSDTMIHLPFLSAMLALDGQSFHIQFLADTQAGQVERKLSSLAIPTGEMAALLSEQRTVLIDDLRKSNDFDLLLSFLARRGCTSAALIAIVDGSGRLTRVLALGAREEPHITSAGLQPYINLAEVISAALEKFRVLNALQERLSELQIMAAFSEAITVETDLQRLYHVLHQQVMQTFGPDLEFAVAIYNQQRNLIEFPYFFEQGELISIPPFPLGEGLTSILIQGRQPLLLPDEKSIQAHSSKVIGKPARSWMGIPLIAAGDLVGVVILQDLESEGRFTQNDVNLFTTLAPQIATAIRNTQLYTETQQALRAYDLERFYFNSLLENMPEGISFKNVNGRYLRASASVAQIINARSEDLIGKTDGDLFDTPTAEAIAQQEQQILQSGKPEIGSIQPVRSRTGDMIWMHTTRIPIRIPGEEGQGLLVIQRDVTELKEAEEIARRRTEQVRTAADIAREATATLDVSVLLQKAVNLVRERYGFYHASVFLLDKAGEYAVLRESTGLAGKKMLEAGHRLAVNSRSIVGQVTASGKAMIVNDVHRSPTHLPNPLLPETRSEMALPLIVGDRVLGALDVQSTQVNAFDDEDISILQILADQVAVAAVNSELFAKTQELLNRHRLLRKITTAASAASTVEDALMGLVCGLAEARIGDRVAILIAEADGILHVRASAGYEGSRHLDFRIPLGQGITGCAAAERRAICVDDTRSDPRYMNIDPEVRSELALPILFNDRIIGVLNLESTQLSAFDENDQEMLTALGSTLGGIISNVQLLQQVRQQVAHEQQLFAVTSKIRRSVDLQNILETTSKELCAALGARRVRMEITAGEATAATRAKESGANGAGSGMKERGAE